MATDAASMVSLSRRGAGRSYWWRSGASVAPITDGMSRTGDGPGAPGEAPGHSGETGQHQQRDRAPEPEQRSAERPGQDGGGDEHGEGADHGAGQEAEVAGADEDAVEDKHHR